MPTYTCITNNRESNHLSQHSAESAAEALRKHIGQLPYDDGDDMPDSELDWLQSVASGVARHELIEVRNCRNTWLWPDGLKRDTQYLTHIVQTEI